MGQRFFQFLPTRQSKKKEEIEKLKMFLKNKLYVFLFCFLISNAHGKPQNSESTASCATFEDDGYR